MIDRIGKERYTYDTVAIICRTMAEAKAVYDACKETIPITLLTEDTAFQKGILVTPFYLAKGLEFDAVHVPYITENDAMDELDRQAYYIACTRALHRLSVYKLISVD